MSDPLNLLSPEAGLDAVAAEILAAIDDDRTGPYVMPWHGVARLPSNPIGGNGFKGQNILILWSHQRKRRLQSFYWAKEGAWKRKGAAIKAGAVPAIILQPVYDQVRGKKWDAEALAKSPRLRKDVGKVGGDPAGGKLPVLIGFEKGEVFNQDDVVGGAVARPGAPSAVETIAVAERLIKAWHGPGREVTGRPGPALVIGGAVACYDPGRDLVRMPPAHAFHDVGEGEVKVTAGQHRVAVHIHEIAHSSGSKNRLNRKFATSFGTPAYAREELRAELAAAMIGARMGLATSLRQSHAAYVKSWMETLQTGRRDFFDAVKDAERIVTMVLARAGMRDEACP
jgi:antirestriction protein ArdC